MAKATITTGESGLNVRNALNSMFTELYGLIAALGSPLKVPAALDASGNPNYPAGAAGDTYKITVAGKVGGASGIVVEIGDMVVCFATNAGGTQAAVGTSWYVVQANIAAIITAAGVAMISAADAAAQVALLGLVIGTNVQAYSAALTRLAAGPVTLTDASSIATDAGLSTVFDVTLGGDRTLANPTNPADGMRVLWRIKQDGTGTRTLTLGSAFRIPSSSTLTSPLNSATFTTADKTTNLAAVYNAAASKWDLVAEVEGY